MTKIDLAGKRVVLLLQGGGALGSYHVGVFEALSNYLKDHHGRQIDLVAGVSIGAINAAVIAGNDPDHAVARLEEMWHGFRWPSYDALIPFTPAYWWSWLEPLVGKYFDWWMVAFPFGQRSFFRSRVLSPFENPWIRQWFKPSKANEIAFYDPSPLRDTLNNYVNWDRINVDGGTQLSLGAANLETAELQFFNSFESQAKETSSRRVKIAADHVLASAALPPVFPAVEIEGKMYWDGGLVSNTPLMDLQDELRAGDKDTFVFDIHIFERQGPQPRSLDEVIWRQKSIQFGSRKRQAVEIVSKHEAEAQAKAKAGGSQRKFEVCQVMYEVIPGSPQFWFTDGDLSTTAMRTLQEQGRRDMHDALEDVTVIVEGEFGLLYRIGSCRKDEPAHLAPRALAAAALPAR